jgi:hypothetical protein
MGLWKAPSEYRKLRCSTLIAFTANMNRDQQIDNYVDYYNNGRFEEKLNGMTLIEFRNHPLTT